MREDFEMPDQEPEDFDQDEGNNEDNTLTFEEYSQKSGQNGIHQPLNEAKVKITDEQLLQALGKATPLPSRKDSEMDNHTESPGKKRPKNQKMNMKTDHMNLLGKSYANYFCAYLCKYLVGFETPDEGTQSKKTQDKRESKVIPLITRFFIQ